MDKYMSLAGNYYRRQARADVKIQHSYWIAGSKRMKAMQLCEDVQKYYKEELECIDVDLLTNLGVLYAQNSRL